MFTESIDIEELVRNPETIDEFLRFLDDDILDSIAYREVREHGEDSPIVNMVCREFIRRYPVPDRGSEDIPF